MLYRLHAVALCTHSIRSCDALLTHRLFSASSFLFAFLKWTYTVSGSYGTKAAAFFSRFFHSLEKGLRFGLISCTDARPIRTNRNARIQQKQSLGRAAGGTDKFGLMDRPDKGVPHPPLHKTWGVSKMDRACYSAGVRVQPF